MVAGGRIAHRMRENLTPRQELFAHHLAISGKGTQSAIKAGYSPKSAHVSASILLKNNKILARIAQLRETALAQLRDEINKCLCDSLKLTLRLGRKLTQARRGPGTIKHLGTFQY